MSPVRRTLLLLAIVGVLLLTNPLWLVPHEGDARYTYDRTAIEVHNGTLAYKGTDLPGVSDEENSLNPVACQADDDQPRACALDHHFVDDAPVTVPREPWTFDTSRPVYRGERGLLSAGSANLRGRC